MKKALKKVVPEITGMHDGIRGNVDGIRGELSGIRGNVDDCELSDEERIAGVHIYDLIG